MPTFVRRFPLLSSLQNHFFEEAGSLFDGVLDLGLVERRLVLNEKRHGVLFAAGNKPMFAHLLVLVEEIVVHRL